MRTESIAGAITDNNDHSHSTTDASDGVRFIATLITIPGEIFLQIASLLDVADVISLRKVGFISELDSIQLAFDTVRIV